jgi:hypothetical protein
MRKLLTGVAIVALGMAIGACNREPAATNDVVADTNTNTEVLVDENAAMDANATMDANAMDANATMNADDATNNVTEQGSTDH